MDYRRRAEVVQMPPIRLWVETSSICNLRCPMCPNQRMPAAQKGLMDLELFNKIVSEARGFVRDMYLHHRGEPLLNPALFEMIHAAKQAGISTRFHTNGTLLTAQKAEQLVAAEPDLVSFSIDGFEKGAYERIRVGANFEQVIENVVRLARLRDAQRLSRPYIVVERIKFRNPDMAENKQAVADLTRQFLEAGVNEVIEKQEYTWAEETAPEPGGQPRYTVCTFPWYAMVICADGTVTPCPQDFWAKMNMGNVRTAGLLEIWNGAAYQKLRRDFRTNIQALPLCRKCDRLQRKTVGGVPWQYLITFLVDQFVGYHRRWRRLVGTAERN